MYHYLTKPEIAEHFGRHITKKELAIQTEGSTITLNGDQIVIITDPQFSKLNLKYTDEDTKS